MNNKILTSLILIGAVVAFFIGGTYAAWTATTSIDSNTFATATVSLNTTGLIEKPVNAVNMLPGQSSEWGKAGIYNSGSVPLKIYMYVEIVQNDNNICDVIDLEIRAGDNDPVGHLVTLQPISAYEGENNRVELTSAPMFTDLAAGSTQILWQQATLHANAGNQYQNSSCVWNEIFIGETL